MAKARQDAISGTVQAQQAASLSEVAQSATQTERAAEGAFSRDSGREPPAVAQRRRVYCVCGEVFPTKEAHEEHRSAAAYDQMGNRLSSHLRVSLSEWRWLMRDDGAEEAYAEHTNPY